MWWMLLFCLFVLHKYWQTCCVLLHNIIQSLMTVLMIAAAALLAQECFTSLGIVVTTGCFLDIDSKI